MPVAVAALLKVRVFTEIEAMVVLAGIPVPVTLWPANRPVALTTSTEVVALRTPGNCCAEVPSAKVAAVPESTRRVRAEAPLLTIRAFTVAAAEVR